jgi:Cu/Ag efflux pump CusA
MGLPLTLMSIFGMVALTGVVVNDSIVLIDFINARIRQGTPIVEALIESGQRRLRPVLLTSVTTIGGLAPLILERSIQAQYLIPMAVTLSFGLMFTTVIALLLVPTVYLLYSWVMPVTTDEEEIPQPRETEYSIPEAEEAYQGAFPKVGNGPLSEAVYAEPHPE